MSNPTEIKSGNRIDYLEYRVTRKGNVPAQRSEIIQLPHPNVIGWFDVVATPSINEGYMAAPGVFGRADQREFKKDHIEREDIKFHSRIHKNEPLTLIIKFTN